MSTTVYRNVQYGSGVIATGGSIHGELVQRLNP